MMSRDVRVTPGGIFHTRKVDYSPETQKFLKELIEESKMSMIQRKLINESVKKGDPLPLPPKLPEPKKYRSDKWMGEDIKKFYLPRRRRKEQIALSGAYDREEDVSYISPVDYEREKRRLQDLMAFGKTIKPRAAMPPATTKEQDELEKKCEKIGSILKEIEEREQFLNEMKKLGQGKQYEGIIRQEIAAKLRTLEEMDGDLRDVLKKEYSERQDIKAATQNIFQS